MSLIDRADSVLIVIDAQPGFSGATDDDAAASARSRAITAWLVGVAAAFDIPIVVTEEDRAMNGATDPGIVANLPAGTPVLPKGVFGLADEPEIMRAIEATGRRTAVLVGAETDVCVDQSAIGLQDRGFRVVAVSDATFSPGDMHEAGLDHLRDSGVEIRRAKAVYYEWARTLESTREIETGYPGLRPPPGYRL